MKSILFIFSIILFASCKTNLVYINVTNPAPVNIPPSVKNAGIVNRSVPSDSNKILNAIHQNANAQSIKLIKEGSTESIKGLNNALIEYKRFDIIKPITNLDLRTPTAGSFPVPLTWQEVEKICSDNGIDILLALEVYDTDLKVIPLTTPPKINNPTDVVNAIGQAQADIVTTIKVGWRIYNPKLKMVLDEYPMTDNMSIRANAFTVVNTVEAMMGRIESIKQQSNRMGAVYANRLIPYQTKVTRDYFVKGTGNFKIATRKARTGNWDGAGELWKKETENSKRKIAGRAHYNMAILSEINGDLDMAIQWAQKAYENYNNRLALEYVNKLKVRKQLVQNLNYQQGN